MKNKKQSGFTLLELLLVVGVGALLIIGGISTYRIVVEGNRVNDSVRILMTIKQEAQKLYQGQNNYGTLSNTMMQNINAMPDSGRHPFNDTITVRANTTNNSWFDVVYTNIPSSACMRLAKAMIEPSDVEQIVVDTLTISNDDLKNQSYDYVGQLSANGACGNDTEKTITWTFR